MGSLLALLTVVICVFLPPILIYRSNLISGLNKTKWVIGCFLSSFLPSILTSLFLSALLQSGANQANQKSLFFGFTSWVMFLSNIAMLVIPWLIYITFKVMYRKTLTPHSSGTPNGAP